MLRPIGAVFLTIALPFARMCGYHLLATLVLFVAHLLIVRNQGRDRTGSDLTAAPNV